MSLFACLEKKKKVHYPSQNREKSTYVGEENGNSWPLITIAFCFNMITLSIQSAAIFPKLKKKTPTQLNGSTSLSTPGVWLTCLLLLSKSSAMMTAKHSCFVLFTFCIVICSMFVARASIKLFYLNVSCTLTM